MHRYTVFVGGKPAGVQVVTVRSPRERSCGFRFSDRSLGPDITQKITVDAEGIPTLIETRGKNFWQTVVDERFVRTPALASWRTAGGNGERQQPGAAFYLSVDGTPEETAVMARALLRRGGKAMTLLPAGEARIERCDTQEVASGSMRERVVFHGDQWTRPSAHRPVAGPAGRVVCHGPHHPRRMGVGLDPARAPGEPRSIPTSGTAGRRADEASAHPGCNHRCAAVRLCPRQDVAWNDRAHRRRPGKRGRSRRNGEVATGDRKEARRRTEPSCQAYGTCTLTSVPIRARC